MYCLIALRPDDIVPFKKGLQSIMNDFINWQFDYCKSVDELFDYISKQPDVVVFSYDFPCNDSRELLKNLPVMFSASRIVLLTLDLVTSERKAYEKLANSYGIYNIVVGGLPGERPYDIRNALKKDINEVIDASGNIISKNNSDEIFRKIKGIQAESAKVGVKNTSSNRLEDLTQERVQKFNSSPTTSDVKDVERTLDEKAQSLQIKHNLFDTKESQHKDQKYYSPVQETVYREQLEDYPKQHHQSDIMKQRHGRFSKQTLAQHEHLNVSHEKQDRNTQKKVPLPGQPLIRRGYQGGNSQGKLILTAANKGGVGKTTTAITVAKALANAGVEVILADLNLPGPCVHSFFDIKPSRGIEALASYNMILLEQVLIKAPNQENLIILPGLMDKTIFPDGLFEQGELAELIGTLLTKAPVVIVDTPSNFWDKLWLEEVFEMADMVLAVVDQSKFSEDDTNESSRKILEMGVTPEIIKIVINKFSPKLHNARIIEKAFNERLIGHVPKKALPKVIATIPIEWDKYNLLGYKGEAAGLDDHMSQWHRLAEEIANLTGFKYKKPDQNSVKKKGLFGIFKRR